MALRTVDQELEERLIAAIEPWLEHMRWRPDFASWRKRRIYQEDYQADLVADARQALGGELAGKRLLDIGSGMGGPAVALARAGVEVYGLDLNAAYLEIAHLRGQRHGLDLPLVRGVGEALPFPSAYFDAVLCMDVIEHVAEPARVLREIARVLKPGGVAICSAPNRFAFRDAHYHLPGINWLPRPIAERIIGLMGRSKTGGRHFADRQELAELNTYTWATLRQEAARAGLRARDAVEDRLRFGTIRQLQGPRLTLLRLVTRAGLLAPLYRLYRFAFQGTFQIRLRKPPIR